MKVNRVIQLFGRLLFNIPFASFTLAKVGSRVSKSFRKRERYWLYTLLFFTLFILSIVFCIMEVLVSGACVIGLFSYFCFCGCMAVIRKRTRNKLEIEGSIIEDFVVSVMLYPSVAVQLEIATANVIKKEQENDATSNI